MMRVAAVIQARMGSTRLPGKVLRPIAGRPLLWHVVHRLRRSRHITDICLATTIQAEDDVLAVAASDLGLTVVRGPVDDVLARFAAAAELLDPDFLVRVCADSPLVDAAVIDHLLDAMIAGQADFVTLPEGEACIHEGADPFSRRALRLMLTQAHDDPVAREHVTAWLKRNPERIVTAVAPALPDYAFRGARVSVDAPADVAFLDAVHARLAAPAGELSLPSLVRLLDEDPALLAINAHVRQKDAAQMSGTILVRCDGGHRIGFGHVRRCLTLARALRDRHGFGVRFAMRPDNAANALILEAGFPLDLLPLGEREADWLAGLVSARDAVATVLDIRSDLGPDDLDELKARGALTVLIDDASPRMRAADLVFLPPDRRHDGARIFAGFEWLMLGHAPPQGAVRAQAPGMLRVLLTLGGSDPWGLTVPAVRALAGVSAVFGLDVVLGPGLAAPDLVAGHVRQALPRARVHLAPSDMGPLFGGADLAVTAYGVTALELAAFGVPMVMLAASADHLTSATRLASTGCGVVLPCTDGIPGGALVDCVGGLLSDPARRAAMGEAGRATIDGQGAQRIASLLAGRLQSDRARLSA